VRGWSLAYDGASQTLYAGDLDGKLYTGNPATGATTLVGDTTLARINGMTFRGTSNAEGLLTINAQTINVGASITTNGNQTYSGAVALSSSATLTSDTGTLTFSSTLAAAANAATLVGAEIDFNGGADSVSGTSTLVLKPSDTSSTIGIGGGAGTLEISDTDIAALQDGFSLITIGDAANGTGAVDVGSSTFTDPTTIVGGSIVITGDASGTGGLTFTARTGDITGADLVVDGPATFNGDFSINGSSPGKIQLFKDMDFTSGKNFSVQLNGALVHEA